MSSIRGKRRERMFKQDEERERLYYRLRRWDNSNPNVELNENILISMSTRLMRDTIERSLFLMKNSKILNDENNAELHLFIECSLCFSKRSIKNTLIVAMS